MARAQLLAGESDSRSSLATVASPVRLNHWELSNRARKARRIAEWMHAHQWRAEDLAGFDDARWEAIAQQAGERPPSPATRRAVADQLAGMKPCDFCDFCGRDGCDFDDPYVGRCHRDCAEQIYAYVCRNCSHTVEGRVGELPAGWLRYRGGDFDDLNCVESWQDRQRERP